MYHNYSADYYQLLGVAPTASPDEIKRAYIRLAKLNHPDIGGDLKKMQSLSEAYEVLRKLKSKLDYDEWYKRNFKYNEPFGNKNHGSTESGQNPGPYTQYHESKGHHKETVFANNKGNLAFDVNIYGPEIKIPKFCTCCLGEADQKFKISKSEARRKRAARKKRTVSLEFPICTDCKKHIDDLYKKKRELLIYSSTFGAAASLVINSFITPLGYAGVIFTSLIFLFAALFILNRILKLSPLKDFHSSRGYSVELKTIFGNMITLRFWNRFYAKTIADNNKSKLRTVKSIKNDR